MQSEESALLVFVVALAHALHVLPYRGEEYVDVVHRAGSEIQKTVEGQKGRGMRRERKADVRVHCAQAEPELLARIEPLRVRG